MTNIILIFVGFALVLLNAFFVAAEFGMVKLRATRLTTIAELHPWQGTVLTKIHRHLDAYLSACQLGITLASLGLGWVGEPAFAQVLTWPLHYLGVKSYTLIEFISFLLAFSLLSFLHIVVGELMPKSLAIRQSEQISLWTAIPLYGFYWLMYPVIWVLNSCSNFLLKQLGLDIIHPGEEYHSSDEIKLILHSSQVHGELTAQESSILAHTLELADLRSTDVMRSYDDMVMLDNITTKQALLAILNQYRYSRYPVYDKKQKKIIGLLHVKDLQLLLQEVEEDKCVVLQAYTRPIPKISHRLPVLRLLRQFQGGMPHFALVYGRQNAIVGFVTLDNLLHLVIGVIKDEFHTTHDDWIHHSDNSLTVKGDCSIYVLERALNQKLSLTNEQEEEIATVAGLILHQLGSVPKIGEVVAFDNFSATIKKMKGAKILEVWIQPKLNEKN